MDTKEENILAIKINLISMVDVSTNPQIDFIFSVRTFARKKKDIRNILLLQTDDKYKVFKRKPVVSERSPNLFLHIHACICVYKLIQEVAESHHQSKKIQFL